MGEEHFAPGKLWRAVEGSSQQIDHHRPDRVATSLAVVPRVPEEHVDQFTFIDTDRAQAAEAPGLLTPRYHLAKHRQLFLIVEIAREPRSANNGVHVGSSLECTQSNPRCAC